MSEAESPNERFGLGRWHCDDFLANAGLMQCVRDFLESQRQQRIAAEKLLKQAQTRIGAGMKSKHPDVPFVPAAKPARGRRALP